MERQHLFLDSKEESSQQGYFQWIYLLRATVLQTSLCGLVVLLHTERYLAEIALDRREELANNKEYNRAKRITYPDVISNKMKTLQIFAALMLLAFGELAHAGTKSKCDVVRALRNENVQDSEMRDWLCLVKHESAFKYTAKNSNNDGSTDYGIFQLNDRYWCGRGSTKYSKCWQINTYGCGVDFCNDFLNSNIADDTSCAVKIKTCNSFSKWYAWIKHCKGKNLSSKSEYDFSNC